MSPLEQQRLADAVLKVYAHMEDDLIQNVGKNLAKNKNRFNETDIQTWRTLQEQNIGSLDEANIKAIASKAGLALNEVSSILEQAADIEIGRTDKVLEDAVKQGKATSPVNSDRAKDVTVAAYMERAQGNLSAVHAAMYEQTRQAYTRILDQTVESVLEGDITAQQARRRVAREWADKGVTGFVNRAGAEMSVEARVNMLTRTAINSTINDTQLARLDDYDLDLVIVSEHTGARPKCEPYQNKILSKSGRDPRYTALDDTSYGEPDGLLGNNCGHFLYPFVEGISIQRDDAVGKEENDEAYKESQQQRLLERKIRASKREYNMMEALGDEQGIQEAAERIRQRQANMRGFIESSGRTRRREREQLFANNPRV